MRRPSDLIQSLRRQAGPIENHIVDEFLVGHLDRRALLRHGACAGIAAPLLAALLGTAVPLHTARAQNGKQGGKPGTTLRVACPMPTTAIDPVVVADPGGLNMLIQSGEFLARDGTDLVLRPMLATAWRPNADGSVWTFDLRPGVTFHNGKALTAADVVATMDRLADPANGSNALSAFRGVLSKGGTKQTGDHTVEFHLDAPNGNFPYYVSSDNYNAIILPADYAGDFEKTFVGTGPFKLDRYTPRVGASFVPNPGYWGGDVLPARTEFTFFSDLQPQILALQAGQVDVIMVLAVQGGQGLLNDPDVTLLKLPSSAQRQIHMKTDGQHFSDKRVRQAVALTLDRPGLVRGLFRGLAQPGNDSPIAAVYPSAAKDVPQRTRDIDQAKRLMAEAGHAAGFEATLTTHRLLEVPDLAVLVQNACAQIGIKLNLRIEDTRAYYGSGRPGTSDWLDSEMGITDFGHRGIPNILLAAPLLSDGAWNAAHFKNPAYDALVADYVKATDLGIQRALSGKIDALLLDETPVVIPYFYNTLAALAKGVTGVETTAIPQMFLQQASAA